jgi:hypothetical protein
METSAAVLAPVFEPAATLFVLSAGSILLSVVNESIRRAAEASLEVELDLDTATALPSTLFIMLLIDDKPPDVIIVLKLGLLSVFLSNNFLTS